MIIVSLLLVALVLFTVWDASSSDHP